MSPTILESISDDDEELFSIVISSDDEEDEKSECISIDSTPGKACSYLTTKGKTKIRTYPFMIE